MSETPAFTVDSPPYDSISKVRYSPTDPNVLLASSWDATVRLYEVGQVDGKPSEQKTKFDHRAAVLDCCFSDATHAFSGGLDTYVRHLKLDTEEIENVGTHSDSVSSTVWANETNSLITGSWDRTLRVWDPRAATPQQASIETPERVYTMDVTGNRLVVALASRLFHIYDVRNMNQPAQVRDSSLKYMTRSLACMTTGEGYATASIEGRIAVEYFDPSKEAQELKYAFKCHRAVIDGADHVWPVNSLVFHPKYNTFASAGSDGNVSMWDHKTKKRLKQFKYTQPVASVALNCDGSKMAIATSYTWDEGEAGVKTAESPAIHIRVLSDEMKPKQ